MNPIEQNSLWSQNPPETSDKTGPFYVISSFPKDYLQSMDPPCRQDCFKENKKGWKHYKKVTKLDKALKGQFVLYDCKRGVIAHCPTEGEIYQIRATLLSQLSSDDYLFNSLIVKIK